jgi:hypothetical protein
MGPFLLETRVFGTQIDHATYSFDEPTNFGIDMPIICTAKNIRRIIFSHKFVVIRHSLLGIPTYFLHLLLKDITILIKAYFIRDMLL